MDKKYEGNKVVDFFIGFGGVVGSYVIVWIISMATFFLDYREQQVLYAAFNILSSVLGLAVLVAAIFFSIKFFRTRKWISIGILFAILLPIIILLLVFGACLMMFRGW